MPTFNGGSYLGATLESIICQDLGGVEVIVVDDGSSDDTLEILHAYARRLPLRIVEGARGGSWVRATNHGLELAEGVYASFLHQDDLWLPGRLTAVRRALDEHHGTVLLLHPARFIDAEGGRVGNWSAPLPPNTPDLAGILVLERLLVQNFVPIPSPAFLREEAIRAGNLDETLWFTADWDLWLRLAALGRTLYLPASLAAFRLHPTSQTWVGSSSAIELHTQYTRVLERHLRIWRPRLAEAAASVEAAARFSIEVNTCLASVSNRGAPHLRRLAGAALRLGPRALFRFLRDSRVHQRAGARFRARLWRSAR